VRRVVELPPLVAVAEVSSGEQYCSAISVVGFFSVVILLLLGADDGSQSITNAPKNDAINIKTVLISDAKI
jgi:hypothetical protein